MLTGRRPGIPGIPGYLLVASQILSELLVNLFNISDDACLAIGFHFGPDHAAAIPKRKNVCECPSVCIFCRRKETAFAMAKAAEVLPMSI